MLGARGGTHVEDYILEAGGLRGWPMNSGCFGPTWNLRQIEDEITYLAIKDIGGAPIKVGGVIVVCIYQSKAREGGCGSNNGQVVGVANELGVVIVQDGRRDEIGSSWEVNHCRSGCGR